MKNILISIIRTAVPSLVGLLVAWLVTMGVVIDPATATAFSEALIGILVPVVGTLYYAVVRFLEERFGDKWGWLLGYAQSPDSYSPTASGPFDRDEVNV